jgi:hypothetical protein
MTGGVLAADDDDDAVAANVGIATDGGAESSVTSIETVFARLLALPPPPLTMVWRPIL